MDIALGLRDLALVTGALAAAITALVTFSRLPVFRYLAEVLVLKPVEVLFTGIIHRAVANSPVIADLHHEVTRNDGSSLKDAVARVEERLVAGDRNFEDARRQFAMNSERLNMQGRVLLDHGHTLARIEDQVDRLAGASRDPDARPEVPRN